MNSRFLAVLLAFSSLSGPTLAKPDWPQVQAELRIIPTVAGLSALDRMGSCGMRIDRRASWAEPATQDVPGQEIKAGDMLVEVYFDLPRPGGAGTSTGGDPAFTGILARWYIRADRALPQSGWAANIQNRKPPLDWMQC